MTRRVIILITAVAAFSVTAMADVKVKSRQTIGGQVTENTSYIKGKRQRTEMMNGMIVSITQCDLSRDVQLNSQTKTYLVNLYDDGVSEKSGKGEASPSVAGTRGGTVNVTTTIKDTGERKQMFGYTARHIKQTVQMESSADACAPVNTKMEMDMWVIDAEFGLTCSTSRHYQPSFNSGNSGCRDRYVQKTIGSAKTGYPVYQKMTSFDGEGKESFSMVQEVLEISMTALDAALFEAPPDYREAKNASDMYASAATGNSTGKYNGKGGESGGESGSSANRAGLAASISQSAVPQSENGAATLGAKQPGTVRLGIAAVKTGTVGEGIAAADLAAAVRNTLTEFLKGTKIEIVQLETRLASAQVEEARQKSCDYVVYATVSHKKGGGGFGFGKMLAQTVSHTGVLGHTGSVAGNIAGNLASQAIVSAASLSENVKKKDEITLDLKAQSAIDNSSSLARQFKGKAESDGDDIISRILEQGAQALLDALGK